MAEGNSHLGYKEALNVHRGAEPGRQARLLLRVPRARPRRCSRPRPMAEQARAAARARRAARRPPARCARSAGCVDRPGPDGVARRAAADDAAVRAGDRVLLFDTQGPPLPRHPGPGGEFHTHAGVVRHDELIGQRRGHHRAGPRTAPRTPRCGRPWPTSSSRCPAAPRSSIPRTSAPILSWPTSSPARASSSPASGPGRCRWRCCGPGAEVAGYELRDDFAARAQANVAVVPRADGAGALPRRGPRRLRGHRRDRPRPHRARPARAVAGGQARRGRPAPGRHPRVYLPTIGQVAQLRDDARRQRRSAWPRRSRCCSAAGTSRASRCGPTTAWSPTPASSPPPACSTPDADGRPRPRHPRRGRRLAAVGGYRLGFLARVVVLGRAGRRACRRASSSLPDGHRRSFNGPTRRAARRHARRPARRRVHRPGARPARPASASTAFLPLGPAAHGRPGRRRRRSARSACSSWLWAAAAVDGRRLRLAGRARLATRPSPAGRPTPPAAARDLRGPAPPGRRRRRSPRCSTRCGPRPTRARRRPARR